MQIDNKLATLYARSKGWRSKVFDYQTMKEINNPQTSHDFLLEIVNKEVRAFLAEKEGQAAKQEALLNPNLIANQ